MKQNTVRRRPACSAALFLTMAVCFGTSTKTYETVKPHDNDCTAQRFSSKKIKISRGERQQELSPSHREIGYRTVKLKLASLQSRREFPPPVNCTQRTRVQNLV
uniref:Secreted protein n=1 Tax=Sipha flava TaxID=143950 RepID=A0A2S2QJ71_9HEMI